jgi:hypothetical protein
MGAALIPLFSFGRRAGVWEPGFPRTMRESGFPSPIGLVPAPVADETNRCRSNIHGPEPVPHPDVIIDSETGEVRYDGPVNEEQQAAEEWLRANSPEIKRRLMQINEQLESDPKNSELRKQQREFAKFVGWLRDDMLKCNMKRTMRDALRRPPGKSSKD